MIGDEVTWSNEARLTDFIKIRDNVIPDHMCKLMIDCFNDDADYHVASAVGADEKEQEIMERASIQQKMLDGKALPHTEVYRQGHMDLEGRKAIEMNVSARAVENPNWHKIVKFMNHNTVQQFLWYKEQMAEMGYPPYTFPRKFRLEQWRMHRYNVGEHFFKGHIDSTDLKSAKRFLVFLYYPNTVKQGGETAFTHQLEGVSVRPKEGRVLIAPTWMGYPHEAKTPISNTKYLIKTYLHYPNEVD